MSTSIIPEFREQLLTHKSSLTELNTLFLQNPDRAKAFSCSAGSLFFDYSKNLIDEASFTTLIDMAESAQLSEKIAALFAGEKINRSENRPALHTALRSQKKLLEVDGENIMDDIARQLESMSNLCEDVESGKIRSATGKPFTHVINIGIGGSDLGPKLVVDALQDYCTTRLDVRFVSNLDKNDFIEQCQHANAETTLFIVASKSFTTLETMTNAKTAKQWLIDNGCRDHTKHFIAVTANPAKASEYGIADEQILEFGEWVGGRYSLWSTIGLPIALAMGMDNFRRLLKGAEIMDLHFQQEKSGSNMPVVMALLDVWYSIVYEANNLAVVPYNQRLQLLPEYLSQLMMESNGKSVAQDGSNIEDPAGQIIWGSVGTNAQHAFFQFLHQSEHFVPVDFITTLQAADSSPAHQDGLIANCIAQSEALMKGDHSRAQEEPHRFFPGNKPSTMIILDTLNPETLGMLLAFYEHRTYVQACLWGINAFDQWGVELGKKLAGSIMQDFDSNSVADSHDSSTRQLMQRYLDSRG